MSGIFSVLSDSQSGMFRVQQAKKAWERDLDAMSGKDADQRLADKADRAQMPFALTPQQQRDHARAVSAMEEAKRIGGPKASAEQRLAEVERKIAELKLMMRHAHGDREKLAQLAREAAILAREAGRAAKEYGVGMAAAAEMGKEGGAGVGIEVERTITRTSLTVVRTEMSVDVSVTVGAGDASAMEGAAGLEAGADGEALQPALADGALPPELADMVNAALAGLQGGLQSGLGGARTDKGRELMQRMLNENDLRMSRYKEADAFGRRVEQVLATAKSVIADAKAANELDVSEERRKARRDSFKAYDKILEGAQKEVESLRQAAFGSSITTEDFLDAIADATGADATGGRATGGSVADAAAVTTDPALAGARAAVNLLA